MSLKDEIIDDFRSKVEKQNPWQPYTGPAGGQGWMNMLTGEVRYQENRPAPGEGMPEDHEDDIPTPEEEPADTLDPYEPTVEDYKEVIDTGTYVSVDGVEGEVQSVHDDSMDVDFAEGIGIKPVGFDELDGNLVEVSPPDGWARGWTSPPEDTSELDSGMTIEVYDLAAGEYVEGEIRQVKEDWDEEGRTYVDVITEDGDVYEFLDGEGTGSGENSVLTAVEEVPDFGDAVESVEDVEVGERYYVDTEHSVFNDTFSDGSPGPTEIEVTDVNETTDSAVFTIESQENGEKGSLTGAHIEGAEMDVWEAPPEFFDPVEVPGLFDEEEPVWGPIDGEEVVMDHPVFGEAEGEVDVSEGPDGWDWLTIEEGSVDPEELEVGDEFEYEHSGTGEVYEAEVVEVSSDPNYDAVGIDRGDGEVMWIDHDQIVQEGEEVSLTTNPEHPLYVGDHLESTENPWRDFPEDLGSKEDVVEDFKTGDKILRGGDVQEVKQVGDREIRTEDGWLSGGDLDAIEGYYQNDPIEPDGWMEASTWQPIADVDPVDGSVEKEPFYPGDFVYYYDEDESEMAVDPVEEYLEDEDAVELEDGSVVPREVMEGKSPDGQPPLPESVQDLHWTEPGEYVEVSYYDHNGDIREAEGIVMGYDQMSGETTLYDPDSGETFMTPRDEDDVAVTEHDEDPEYDLRGDWEEDGADDIASDIEERIGLTHEAHKLGQDRKERLRGELMQHFPPEAVAEFYDLQAEGNNSWKSTSGSPEAETYERAFKRALGIEKEARDRGGSRPTKRLQKVAEVASELSQRHFDAQFGGEERLYRGMSSTGAMGMAAQFIKDPTRDAYSSSLLAINNFSLNENTATNFDHGATMEYDVTSDDIVAMHDYLFTPPGSHDTEDEITVRGDLDRIPADQIYIDHGAGDGVPLDKGPMEWSETEAYRIASQFESFGPPLVGELHSAQNPEKAFENALAIRDALEHEHDVSVSSNDFFREVEDRAEKMGLDPDEIYNPEVGDTELLAPDGIAEGSDFVEGMEATATLPNGERHAPVEVVETASTVDEVKVSHYDTGEEWWIDAEDVEEIEWSPEPYGEGAETIGTVDVDDIHQGMPVYWEPMDGPVQYGAIYEIGTNDAGEVADVKVGEPGDTQWRGVEDLGDPDAVEGDGDPEEDVGFDTPSDPSEVGEGDVVEVNTKYEDEPIAVEIESDQGGYFSATPVDPEEASYDNYSVDPGDIVTEESEGSDDSGGFVTSDVGLGDEVRFDHFDVGETTGTVIGYNEDEGHYYVDMSAPGEKPYASGIYQLDTGEIQDIEGESDVDPTAVDLLDSVEGFTQDLPSAPEGSDGGVPTPDDVDPTNYSTGETFEMQAFGEHGPTEEFEVLIPAMDSQDPVEIGEVETGARYLLWPDGEMEEV